MLQGSLLGSWIEQNCLVYFFFSLIFFFANKYYPFLNVVFSPIFFVLKNTILSLMLNNTTRIKLIGRVLCHCNARFYFLTCRMNGSLLLYLSCIHTSSHFLSPPHSLSLTCPISVCSALSLNFPQLADPLSRTCHSVTVSPLLHRL